MEGQNTIENLKAIRKMANRNTLMFNMAITHLFSCGMDKFTEESYTDAVKNIKESHQQAEQNGDIRFMTLEFEIALLEMAYQLSKYPLFDILLVIKKDMVIHDPEAAEADDDSQDYTLEQVKELRDIPVWLEMDGERTLVIVSGYEWRQGHATEWMLFQNYTSLPLEDYKTEWALYPYHSKM